MRSVRTESNLFQKLLRRYEGSLGAVFVLAILAITAAAYSNHFGNGFHFDDFHTVTDNVHIRSLQNIPRFFSDASLFSNLPTHQVYRPVVSTSLALDYKIGGGLKPWAFHAGTFFWYLVQIAIMFFLFRQLTGGREGVAFWAAAIYAVHPVSAETVNYVIQRGDLYSTLGVIAALALYVLKPSLRRYGLYLVPFVLAMLSKPPAIVFPVLLILYVRLFEEQTWRASLRKSVPSWIAAAACAVLVTRMVAATFHPGGGSRTAYWITQTWVTFQYATAFFWPTRLSADSDEHLLAGFPPQALIGFAFVAALVVLAILLARTPGWRPASFGIGWFLVALLPAAIMPLAEVSNDHRMFFPFVGLSLAVCWSASKWSDMAGAATRRILTGVLVLVLAASAFGTWNRNQVWLNEETLWRDVTQKSPSNGRGWMNYGLTLMARADYANALVCFEKASVLSPGYSLAEVNLGIVKGAMGRRQDAEEHFRRALVLAPGHAASHHYYGRWLLEQGRYREAIPKLENALRITPGDQPIRHHLMRAHFDQQNWSALRELTATALALDASDQVARGYAARLDALDAQIRQAPRTTARTPESYIELSLLYYRAGRFADSVKAARDAARLRPDYALAYNNMAAGYNAIERWDEAIEAGTRAVRLDPANQLARNNLAWAIESKRRSRR